MNIKLILFSTFSIFSSAALYAQQLQLNQLSLPKGFSIDVYAGNVDGARQLTIDDQGVVFVGSRGEGKVYALMPNASKTKAKKVITLLSGLNYPNGVSFHEGKLYVGELDQVSMYKLSRTTNTIKASPNGVIGSFPNKRWHGYKYIKFSPEGKLYTAVGMPCNTCFYRDTQPIFGTIVKINATDDIEIMARGIRNSVGFDWQPKSGSLWFTDNGQDMLGDDTPPDELNRISYKGEDFGFPYVYGDNVPAPDYIGKPIPKNLTKPEHKFQAHVAPLGMTFYTGGQFPKPYQNQMLISQHGSWNRTTPVGYRIMLVTLNGSKITQVKPFISGWLGDKNQVLGRPVDILNMPDGSILISDDYANAVYRVSYQNAHSLSHQNK
ncbi:PQQ-dependent sugar dehydrogenase [Shewanella sp. 202IG2-18]|uniref:PQQ-dependent sugar dehydrogenase n=1 Tax=Parashewanella hymeniacidonis TaxID=2807618 RepID=UPI00195FDB41|nr:PQQ-dependent sugar dehydrogenase [Parashewanella hymeniacidonis]MBM7071186.1 PQQ-dependent sugar dehydrogenase [Parashewanella hymeniacidonis]